MAFLSSSNETRTILTLVAITFMIGVAGIFASSFLMQDRSTDYIESYTATLYPDGVLEETYVYRLGTAGSRMLYRNFDEPLTFDSYDGFYIIPISIEPPPGSVAYVKDTLGYVTLMSINTPNAKIGEIGTLAEYDEAGCYLPSRFPAGTYTIRYTFKLYPEVEADAGYEHLNLQFAIDHLPYKNVKITFSDAGYISAAYPHPPSLKVSRVGNDLIFTGSSSENELLEVEFLMQSGSSGFTSTKYPLPDVKALTEKANSDYSSKYYTASNFSLASNTVVLMVPIIIFALWYMFGREDEVTVPTYLSTLPNPERKPWFVNLVFDKGLMDFDENGFYATLLDLHTRGKIKIETRENGVKIQILDATVNDDYENKVMEFLQKYSSTDTTNPSTPKTFDTDTMNVYASKIITGGEASEAFSAQRQLETLFDPLNSATFGSSWKRLAGGFIVNKRFYTYSIAGIGLILLIISFGMRVWASAASNLLLAPMLLGVVVLIQFAATQLTPQMLFSKWIPGMYKEKLEWGAFRANLSDLSQMQKYGTEDLSMWGTWLVYGTALGVGEKVAEAMKTLNVKFDTAIAYAPMMVRRHFHPIRNARRPAPPSSGGGPRRSGGYRGGGGGRVGGGGGRGGGGAGRR